MKLTRIAVGSLVIALVAVSVVRAQQATAQARQEVDRARVLAERHAQEAQVARTSAQADMTLARRRQEKAACQQAERSAQDVQVARAAEQADMAVALQQQARAACKLAEAQAGCCKEEVALRLQEAPERTRHAQSELNLSVMSPEVHRSIQEALENARLAETAMQSPEMQQSLQLALEQVAQLTESVQEPNNELGLTMQRLGRANGSSRRLEERVRALEQHLGMDSDGSDRSLEERVAELERRTMGGKERRARAPGVAAGPRRPARTGAPHSMQPDGPTPMPPGGPWPIPPGGPSPILTPGAEAPEPPGIPVPVQPRTAPKAKSFRWHDADESAGPSAPRPAPGSDLTSERRQEIEEVMQRMRGEMERLRTEMNHLREELGRNGDLEKLRGLGYTGRGEASRER